MVVKGEHQFDISAQQLWNYLMDIDVLAKITPGVSKLEVIEDDKYKTVSEIKIGPVKGSFKGKLEVVDKAEPVSFAIVMEQLSKIGNAHVKVDMQIKDKGAAASELHFDGKAKLSGVIARTGQRVLSGVANTITKEVFASLEAHIAEDQQANPTTSVASDKAKDEEGVDTSEAETNVAEEVTTNVAEEAKPNIVEKSTTATVTTAEAVSEVATNQINKIQEVAGDAASKMKTEVADNVAAGAQNTSGFFTGIINFFKRLFS